MGACMSLFYDTSECRWEETLLAQAVLEASRVEHRKPCPTSFADLSDSDFEEVRQLNTTGGALQPGSGGKLLAWEYAPRAFRLFREAACFKNSISPEDWEQSWQETARTCADRAGLGAGKSGATFLKSNDRNWMIKTIDIKEVKKQMDILRSYLSHFLRCPDSLLMRHLQIIKLQELTESGKASMTKYLLVAENVVASGDLRDDADPRDVMVLNSWDLKGRQPKPGKLPQAGQLSSGKLGKDKELTRVFSIPPDVRREIIGSDPHSDESGEGWGVLRHDADFLMRHNLMDYSLLIHTWPSCRDEHGSNLAPRMTQDQKWLLYAAYDHDGNGLCADAAEGLFLPMARLRELELAEARVRTTRHVDPTGDGSPSAWRGSWEPTDYDAHREALAGQEARRTGLRVSTAARPVHKYHNGIVSAGGDEIYFVGVIDILTEYHRWKRLANCCKKFAFFEDQLSTIPADKYERRFSRYMRDVFPACPPPVIRGVSDATTAAQRRREWVVSGSDRGGGPRGHDEWRLREVGGECEWVTAAAAAGGEGHAAEQWQRLRRRNNLRWQYARVRQRVKSDILQAQQRAAQQLEEDFGLAGVPTAS